MKMLNSLKFITLLLVLAFVSSGCGRKSSTTTGGHGEHSEEGHEEGVVYKEGKGLEVPEEVKKSIGLEIVEVTEEKVSSNISFQVEIYRESSDYMPVSTQARHNQAYGVGLVDREQLKHLRVGTKLTLTVQDSPGTEISGRIIRLDQFAQSALGGTEAIIEIPDSQNQFKLGTYFKASFKAKNAESATVIPREALLTTPTGTFVYVLNERHLFRTAIKTGMESDELIEIKEGLYSGDQIAKKPVQWLWLTELQAVKGGKGCTHGH
jgi:multidrug efflux pump subunit AcrA (membrane-fusion protein)